MKSNNVISVIVIIIIIYLIYKYYKNNKKIKSILFIGDSNTVANFSYADQLQKLRPDLRIEKIAQNGATTDWMLAQLQNELNLNSYDAVAILGGSNDIYGKGETDTTKVNLNKMYLFAKSRGSKVIAISPPNKDFYVNATNEKQSELYDLVTWISLNPFTDYFINFYNMTKDKSFFTSSDGYLHPQANAHNILANTLNNLIS